MHVLDLGSAESIDAFAAALGDVPVDVLINNGGVDARNFGVPDGERDVLQLSGEHFLEEMRINALGPLLLTRFTLDRMRATSRPRIVNVTSQVGSMEIAKIRRRHRLHVVEGRPQHDHGEARDALRDQGVIAYRSIRASSAPTWAGPAPTSTRPRRPR